MIAELPFEPVEMRRPAVRFHGGKWTLAPWIISEMRPHRVYAELYGGGASVLLKKDRAKVEVYNDLDDDIVNLFQVLRDRPRALELIHLLELTPYSRSEFLRAYEITDEPVERARRLVVRSFFGFGSHSFNIENSNGFRSFPSKPYAVEWHGVPQNLRSAIERFQGVVIENRPALEILATYDSPETLFLIDPPYPRSTRDCGGKGYRFEMSDDDHRILAHHLQRVKGMVLVCGYPCDLYDQELYKSWRRVEKTAYAGGQKGRAKRTEVLWMNFDPSAPSASSAVKSS